MTLEEATRQLQLALHDVQVAFDCVGLGELERAQTHVITARVALDATEAVLKQGLSDLTPEEASREGEAAVSVFEADAPS